MAYFVFLTFFSAYFLDFTQIKLFLKFSYFYTKSVY